MIATKKEQLMTEVFLKAAAPIIRKLIQQHVKEHCLGCMEGRPGPHAHLCQQTVYRELISVMRFRVAGYLQSMHEELFAEMRKVVSVEIFKYSILTLKDFLDFFANPNASYPCQRIIWDREWWASLEEYLVKLDVLDRKWENQRARVVRRELVYP